MLFSFLAHADQSTVPNLRGSAFSAAGDVTIMPGQNCYGPDHGALNLGDTFGEIGTDSCRQKCEATLGCTGFVILNDNGSCFLRSNFSPDGTGCEADEAYTTTVLSYEDGTCTDSVCFPESEGGTPCCKDSGGAQLLCGCRETPYFYDYQCHCFS